MRDDRGASSVEYGLIVVAIAAVVVMVVVSVGNLTRQQYEKACDAWNAAAHSGDAAADPVPDPPEAPAFARRGAAPVAQDPAPTC